MGAVRSPPSGLPQKFNLFQMAKGPPSFPQIAVKPQREPSIAFQLKSDNLHCGFLSEQVRTYPKLWESILSAAKKCRYKVPAQKVSGAHIRTRAWTSWWPVTREGWGVCCSLYMKRPGLESLPFTCMSIRGLFSIKVLSDWGAVPVLSSSLQGMKHPFPLKNAWL